MRASVFGLVALCAVTLFAGLNQPPIRESDEAYYAEAGREMLAGGDWLTPHFNNNVRLQKPALFYWLVAGTYAVAGVGAGAARFWSALAGLALVLLTYRIGSRMFDERTGWLAGAITATCFGCFYMARLAQPDMVLAFFITLTIDAGLRAHRDATRETASRWLALSSASAALGFLTKGPIAVLIPLIVLGAVALRERHAWRLSGRQLSLAAAVFAAVGLPWYVAMLEIHGVGYFRSFFLGDNVARFATTRFNTPQPLGYYGPILAWWMMPWSAFLLLGLAELPGLARRWRALSIGEFTLGAWIVLPFLLLTASIGKQSRYVIPLIPPLAIVIANLLVSRITRASSRRRDVMLLLCGGLAAANLIGMAMILKNLYLLVDPPSTSSGLPTAVVAIGVASALVAVTTLLRAWRAIPFAVVLGGVIAWASMQYGLHGSGRADSGTQIAAAVIEARRAGEPVGVFQTMVRSLVFHTGVPDVVLDSQPKFVDFLRRSERVLVVAPSAAVTQAELTIGRPVFRLAELKYFNPASVSFRSLFAPDRDRDVQTILLIANQ